MTIRERDVVAALGQVIAQRIGEPRYNFYFGQNTKFTREDDLLTVGVPNRFLQEWMEKKFSDEVRAAAGELFGCAMRIQFVIDPELFQAARRAQGGVNESAKNENGDTRPQRQEAPATENEEEEEVPVAARPRSASPAGRSQRNPRRWRHLSDFVVGACNRLAHAAALSITEAPGECANPLVLYGPVGTGKTHLLEGIRSGLRRSRPEWKNVRCVPSEDFTNRFLSSMHQGKLGPFRKHFRECDVLLIDDLNFLAKKRATQEEFLHTLDALLAEERQVVVTCDCHPRSSEDFMPELADRLLGGAVWPLLPPDCETRHAILRVKAIQLGVVLPAEVLPSLAQQLRGNVRELEGAIHGIKHYSQVTQRPIDMNLVREALGDLLRHSARAVTLTEIDSAVCAVLHLPAGALQGRERSWAVSHPRMLAMFLARKHTTAAYSQIGKHFGKRNHTTVLAAEKKVRQWLQDGSGPTLVDRPLPIREVVEMIERELRR